MKPQRIYRTEILPLVEAERLDLADFLESLDDHEWAEPSLCPGWTVHDVAAHLTLSTRQSSLVTLARVLRARGDIDAVFAAWARARSAAYDPAEVTAQLRATAGSTHRMVISSPFDPLLDILVHGQDIARPLGRERPVLAERAIPALGHAWTSSFYGAPERFAGLRFVATDADWSTGDGPLEVRAPVGDLLLLATGRTAGLEGVSGPGATEAAERIAGADASRARKSGLEH
ncbi:maleylpyruvate isomerase family mycothiol-dependent enzyme [Pseudonocardia sp. 73-21]|uniref:maleylpyruvate isomerase family mycothiol-dependent enzyme n=1 Tax=Pseudonocardia sp. 73-21 TaxID=1895809 RepID=UPI0026239A7A|nr:maleylpyruvate isomerase family mycothiol-dependent enzyme [Pseudonocardia sp. 73-21]